LSYAPRGEEEWRSIKVTAEYFLVVMPRSATRSTRVERSKRDSAATSLDNRGCEREASFPLGSSTSLGRGTVTE